MKGKFQIGEVAKRFDVSRPSLIYYDKIDLLKPSLVEDNGYRYYTFEDMEKLELILTLKESGLNLKAIKEFMNDPSHKQSISLFLNQIDTIDAKIDALQKLRIVLDKRVQMIAAYETVEFYDDVKVDYFPPVQICKVMLNYDNHSPYETAVKTLKEILDSSPISYGSIASKYGLCISRDDLLTHSFNHYSYVFDSMSDRLDDYPLAEVPGSYYVRCLHKGPYYSTEDTFAYLMNYIDTHNYRITGDAYLIPLVDMWASTSESDYISELMIQVEL